MTSSRFTDPVQKPDSGKFLNKYPIGVHEDGIIHVSQLADHSIKNTNEAVKAGQEVQVTITEVDPGLISRRKSASPAVCRSNKGGASLRASRGSDINRPQPGGDWFSGL